MIDHAGVAALAIPITAGLVSILLFASAGRRSIRDSTLREPRHNATPRIRSWGLYGTFALTLVVTTYLAWIIWFTPKPCPCDGLLKRSLGFSDKTIMVLWLLGAGLAMTGIVLQRKELRKEKERQKERELPPVIFT
jgi:hypothetical protein